MEELLQPILVQGRQVYTTPPLEEINRVRKKDLDRLDTGVKRLVNPHIYHVSLTESLWELKKEMTRARTGKEN